MAPKHKRLLITFGICSLLSLIAFVTVSRYRSQLINFGSNTYKEVLYTNPEDTYDSCIKEEFTIVSSALDKDGDGIEDFQDIVDTARSRIPIDKLYLDKYYTTNGGKPPDGEGVCTDVIWRALEGAGYDLQDEMYQDMSANLSSYPMHIWNMNKPDRLIDFRRVPNVETYLKRNTKSLTTEVKRCDFENLAEWQPGDIVVFNIRNSGPNDHIAIVSDRRNEHGVPFVIHNWGVGTQEDDWLDKGWGIVGHYRFEVD